MTIISEYLEENLSTKEVGRLTGFYAFIPDEVWEKILLNCDLTTLISIGCIDTRLRQLVLSESTQKRYLQIHLKTVKSGFNVYHTIDNVLWGHCREERRVFGRCVYMEGEYRNGKKCGVWVGNNERYTYSDGVLERREYIRDDGNLQSVQEYKNGVEVKAIEYHNNGRVKSITEYGDNGYSTTQTFYDNSSVRDKFSRVYSQFHGKYEWWDICDVNDPCYPYGAKRYETIYIHGFERSKASMSELESFYGRSNDRSKSTSGSDAIDSHGASSPDPFHRTFSQHMP